MGGCFPCFESPKKEGNSNNSSNGVKQVAKKESFKENSAAHSNSHVNILNSDKSKARNSSDSKKEAGLLKEPTANIAAQTFTFRELAAATKNFRPECLLGEGGFGRVYKGRLESTGQVVAVKQLDRNGLQGNREFLVEVLMLSLLHHPNLVNLIGYCADGDQRLLVYEYMPLGSLEDHLHDLPPDKEPLDWSTRMKIAAGAAKGLEYLHDKANPPVIYRDLKSSNILLDEGYFCKLSDFGLAKLGPLGDKTHISTRVMGTYGYCAPEYAMTGQLTLKSDVYSFGVVFLELITGRRAIDNNRGAGEHNLVAWGEKECSHYIKTGQCKFGLTCKFDHPQPAGIPDPPAVPTPAVYETVQSHSLQSAQQYGVIPGNWPVARPAILSGSYLPGSYGPTIFPPGDFPLPGWTPYPAPVSPVASTITQPTVGAGPIYGITQLSPSTAYVSITSAAGTSSSSHKEHAFPERPGQPECQFYLRTGDCKFGSTCKYHHPKTKFSLSPMGLPLHPGAPLCFHYAQSGVCRYGPSCRFNHPIGTLSYSPSASSLTDMPVAPYPLGSTNTTLAPSSSSSNLRPDLLPGPNRGTSSSHLSSTNSSSTSVGSTFSKNGPAPQSSVQHSGPGSAPSN